MTLFRVKRDNLNMNSEIINSPPTLRLREFKICVTNNLLLYKPMSRFEHKHSGWILVFLLLFFIALDLTCQFLLQTKLRLQYNFSFIVIWDVYFILCTRYKSLYDDGHIWYMCTWEPYNFTNSSCKVEFIFIQGY